MTQRQRERQKKKKTGKTTTLYDVRCTFLYISLPFMHDFDVKSPNTFYRGRNKRRGNFISLSELGYCPQEFNFRRVRLHLAK